jgi:hypothetical protein
MSARPIQATHCSHRPTLDDGRPGSSPRGDKITGYRYWSKEFAQKEWTTCGRASGTSQPHRGTARAGDYIVHDFMHESVSA